MKLLAAHFKRRVPKAVAVDQKNLAALYEWIDGERIELDDPARRQKTDICAMNDFISDLRRMSAKAHFDSVAREACLSANELMQQIERRISALCELSEETDLQDFVSNKLNPVFADASNRLMRWYEKTGQNPQADIAQAHRILSPSDFGFHNALRRSDGDLTFVDFEYFGWDDPVKLLADVPWHPGVRLSSVERQVFVEHGIAHLSADDSNLSGRYHAQFPLYGLRWATILLNEFFPKRWQRRVFAGATSADPSVWVVAKARQLAKACDYLQIVQAATKTSPEGPVSALLSVMK